jgi:purine-binding chemotaxis protein CheW
MGIYILNDIWEVQIALENNLVLEEDTQHGRYLTFALGHESFGLEISYVKEIVGMQPITELPEVPAYVKGIINLRGKIIPVIDMRLKFGKELNDYTDRTCIIVVDIQDISVGLIVDNVTEVLAIDDSNIVPPPSAKTGAYNETIKAIGKVGNDVKLLLNCDKLFDTDDHNILENLN